MYAVGAWDSGFDTRQQDYGSGSDEADAYLRRYDRSGNLVWEDFLDVEPAHQYNSHQITARAVTVDGSGNAIVAWSAEYYEGYYEEYGDYRTRLVATFNYLSKYSTSGSKVWRIYTNSNVINDLATDSSGNVYATSGGALTLSHERRSLVGEGQRCDAYRCRGLEHQ